MSYTLNFIDKKAENTAALRLAWSDYNQCIGKIAGGIVPTGNEGKASRSTIEIKSGDVAVLPIDCINAAS